MFSRGTFVSRPESRAERSNDVPMRPTSERATVATNHKTILVKIDLILNFIGRGSLCSSSSARNR